MHPLRTVPLRAGIPLALPYLTRTIQQALPRESGALAVCISVYSASVLMGVPMKASGWTLISSGSLTCVRLMQ